MLEEIEEKIRSCRRCELWKFKTNYVPGEGNPNARIVFVGEAPGREEDRQGRPFVGNAGKYLTEVMERFGLRREDVFITNVLKCRPPNNRDPKPEEIEACKPFLIEQLNAIKPDVIVCLGRHSAKTIFELFGIDFPGITRVRGKVFEVERWGKKVKVVAVYHPAAVLYRPQLKDAFEKDFAKVVDLAKRRDVRDTTLSDFF